MVEQTLNIDYPQENFFNDMLMAKRALEREAISIESRTAYCLQTKKVINIHGMS